MRRFIRFLFGAVSLLSATLCTADEIPFSGAYDLARRAAPGLALARFRVDSAAANKDIAFGRMLPQVTLFGQFSDNDVEYENTVVLQNQQYPGERYGLLVKQSLLNIPDGLEATRLSLVHNQVKEELAVEETELLLQLLETFLGVLLADAELEELTAELHALEKQFEEAQALYEKNLLPITQVLETQTRVNSLQADVIMARGNTEVSREELIKLTGERSSEPMAVQDTFTLLSRFRSVEEAALDAVSQSPAVAAADAALLAAKRGVDREKSTWIPTFELTYSFQHSDVGFDNLSSPPRDTSSFAIGFNYPLVEGGAGFARLRAAWADYYSAVTRLQAQTREAEARARSAWLNFQAVTERLLAARQGIDTAETNVDASRMAVLAGTGRFTDVLTALAQNTRAKGVFNSAKFQYALAWAELELATGASPRALVPVISEALHGM